MFKKLSVAAIALAAAYVGGSYYVGVRAEQQLVAMMNDAQSRANNDLAWEQVQIQHGLFTSTGSMALVLKQVKIDAESPNAAPLKTRIEYTIHHHLHWGRLAHFVWSVTPEKGVAKLIEPLYPKTPSLTGDGILDWSGVATSSMAFPGIDSRSDDMGSLTMAPLVGNFTAGENFFDLKLGVAEFTMRDATTPERVQLKNLGYEVRSDDVASNSVAMTFLLGDMLLVGEDGSSETMNDFRWHVEGAFQNDRLTLNTQNTIASLTAFGNQASNVDISIGINGLHREDLNALAELINEIDGQWLAMNEEQHLRARQLGLSLLARGVTLRAPAIKADVKLLNEDAAQTAGIEGFVVSAEVADPALGIGRITIALDALKVPEFLQLFVPEVAGFKAEVSNALVDGRADLTVKQSLASFTERGRSVRDVAFEASLKGLTAQGLLELIGMTLEHDGDLSELSAEQELRIAQIVQEAASHGLVFQMPVLKGTVDAGAGQIDALQLLGLDFQVKLDEVATGAGMAKFTVEQLTASGPQMVDVPSIENYQLSVSNSVIDGKANYQIEKSIESFVSPVVKLGSCAISVQLTGVSATDLRRLSELAPAFEQGLDLAQAAEVSQILKRAVASGFTLTIPKLELAIDQANVNGQAQIKLAGLGSAPVAAFDVARLAQMQSQIDVTGQSPWLAPLVQQGLALGFLAIDGDVAKGQYQFSDGQLSLNGMVVPADEFVLMANIIIQQALAQAQALADDSSGQSVTRERRGRGN